MDLTVTIALVSLTIAVIVQIAIIARWSGKIDAYMLATAARIDVAEGEIVLLRKGRHESDGLLAQHDGMIKQMLGRRAYDAHVKGGHS